MQEVVVLEVLEMRDGLAEIRLDRLSYFSGTYILQQASVPVMVMTGPNYRAVLKAISTLNCGRRGRTYSAWQLLGLLQFDLRRQNHEVL